jgi:hypothetical protein
MIRFFVVLSVIIFFSCKSPKAVPENVLPVNKMQAVMWDVMQADELVNYYYSRDTSVNRSRKLDSLYQRIFGNHNITSSEFRESFNYYQTRPDLLDIMLDSLYKIATAADTVSRPS